MPWATAASCVRSTRSRSAISTDAPQSSSAQPSSSSVHQALSDTDTAPTDVMAAKAITHSG